MFAGLCVVFILLANIFNYNFILFINNIVRNLLLTRYCFSFLFLNRILFWERRLVLYEILGYCTPDIGLAVRVFANGPGDLGSILGRVIPKTHKMVLDASLLNTQHYKIWMKGKVEQSRERSSTLPYNLVS